MNAGHLLAGAALVAAAAAPAAAADRAAVARAEVQTALDDSAAAWSAGDLDRFMTLYEDTPATAYVSGEKLVIGYRAIRDMYASRFGGGSAAAMGSLSLEMLQFQLLDPDHGFVIGRYHLKRAADPAELSGLTTLLFHRTAAGWRVVSDHTG